MEVMIMDYCLFLRLMCFVLAGFFSVACSSSAFAAETTVFTKTYTFGDAVVLAIADATSERDLDVFPNLDPALAKQYTSTGKVPSAVMVYIVKTGAEVTLIDAGYGNASSLMPSAFDELGIAPEDITTVLVTHMHGDHIGGLLREGQKTFPKAQLLIGRVEHDFWLDEKSLSTFPDRKANFDLARRIVETYGDNLKLFDFEDAVVPGIRALDARGHTPGHTAFLLESGNEKLLFWGDLVHAALLQFPHPELNPRYDMIPEEAASTRKRFMEKAAGEKLPVAGSHMPFPSIINVQKDGESYASQAFLP